MISHIFQFISSNHKSLKNISLTQYNCNYTVIIDLEDSLLDIFNPKKINISKKLGRNNILSILTSKNFSNNNLGIRINSNKSIEFDKDIELLKLIKDKIKWKYIVIPKIESKSDLENYFHLFKKNNILFNELIPIIETVKGIKNIEDIFSQKPTLEFNQAFFGNYDYNLDAENWPFNEYDSEQYWQLIKHIITKITKNGYNYINGAILDLENESALIDILLKTKKLCASKFGQAAISYEQAKKIELIANKKYLRCKISIKNLNLDLNEKINLAKDLIFVFEKNQIKNKSFSVIKKEKIYITPHQYLGAKLFLNKNENN